MNAGTDAAKAALATWARRRAVGALDAAKRIGTRTAAMDSGCTPALAAPAAPLDDARRAAITWRNEHVHAGAAPAACMAADSAVTLSRSIIGEYNDFLGGGLGELGARVAAGNTWAEAATACNSMRIYGWGGTAEDRLDALRAGGSSIGASAECCSGNVHAIELVRRVRRPQSHGERLQAMCGPGFERRARPRSAHSDLLHFRRKDAQALGVELDDIFGNYDDYDEYTLADAIEDAIAPPLQRASARPRSASHTPTARSARSDVPRGTGSAAQSQRRPQAKRTQRTPMTQRTQHNVTRSQHSIYGSAAITRRTAGTGRAKAQGSAMRPRACGLPPTPPTARSASSSSKGSGSQRQPDAPAEAHRQRRAVPRAR